MSHTPFIVIPYGVFASPGAALYKRKEGTEYPYYNKYAEGTLTAMTELAQQLNYLEAEKNNALAVFPTESGMVEQDTVGIPTEDTVSVAERTLRRIRTHIEDADRGKLNLVDVKNHIHNELVLWSESAVR